METVKTQFDFGNGAVPAHKHPNGGGWAAETATVDGSVFVGKLARVYGNAQVYGNARVCGDAWVYGGKWFSSPLHVVGSRHPATNCKPGYIAIGCEIHTFAEWKEHYKEIGVANNYTEEQIEEYKHIIDLFCKIGK